MKSSRENGEGRVERGLLVARSRVLLGESIVPTLRSLSGRKTLRRLVEHDCLSRAKSVARKMTRSLLALTQT